MEIDAKGYAWNIGLSQMFPFFDENEDAILIEHPKTNERVWSPKDLWIVKQEETEELVTLEASFNVVDEQKYKAVIKDKNRVWTFLITESEVQKLKKGELQLFWYKKFLDRKTWIGEWCLVNKTQRELLLGGVTHENLASRSLSVEEWSNFSSIRWLSESSRTLKEVVRTPIRKRKIK